MYTHDRGHIARGTHTEGLCRAAGRRRWLIDRLEREGPGRSDGQPSRFILPVAAATAFNLFPRFRFSIQPRRISTLMHALSAYSVILSFVALVEAWLSRSCRRSCLWKLCCDHFNGGWMIIETIFDYYYYYCYYESRIINFCLILYHIISDKMIQENRMFNRTKIKVSGLSRVP